MGVRARLELELSGFNNGWTDKSADLMGEETGSYGLPGSTPRDRVARTGDCKFSLNNHSSNSAHLAGAYSPDHANCLAGFQEGIRVRYSQVVGASESYKQLVEGGSASSYWRLNESSGDALDSVGSLDGTVNGTVTRLVPSALADGDTGMTFDGSTGWIQLAPAGNFEFTGVAPFTVEFFVKTAAIHATSFMRLVAKVADPGTGRNGWNVVLGPGTDHPGQIIFERWRNGVSSVAYSTAALTLATWHHVACVYNGATMTVYLNGVAGTPVASAASLIASTSVVAAARRGDSAASFFAGSLDEIAIYPAAASAAAIQQRYAARSVATDQHVYILHVGTLDDIVPDPDEFAGSYQVHCTSVDFMDDLARASCSGLSTLEAVRDDQIFSALIATLARQPGAIQVFDGPDVFPVALDKVENRTRVISVLQDVCQSSLSLCFAQGDTLVYEPRNVRAASTTALDTFTTRIVGLDVSRNRLNRLNRVEVTAHPRSIDASPTTVLWSLPAGAGNAVAIPSNTSVVIWTPYTDPVTKQSVGALGVDTTPTPTTDYKLTAAADGTGTDQTAALSVSVSPFANTAKVTYTNSGPDGYLVVARILGRGIYDYVPALLQAEDVESQVNAGLNILSFDAPYQSSIATANEIALYLVNLYKGAATQVRKATFRVPNSDETLAVRLLGRGISDRIALAETLTGLSAARHFFINAVEWRSDERHNLEVSWTLAPADSTSYWLLGVAGRSELDNTTRLGFGLVLGHIDVAHGDLHADVAHSDVAHVDTHTDNAHVDVAHGDSATHGDLAHSDSAHADVAHSDVAHVDAHSDVAHSDRAHSDSHSDVAHQDAAHSDVAHSDVAHDDVHFDNHNDFHDEGSTFTDEHDDFHADAAHSDVVHADSHTDVSHSDTHNDLSHLDSHSDSHSDSAHADVTHSDVAHVDVPHSDGTAHADSIHADVAHADVAHVDSSHSDVAHSDAHTDTEHADIN